MRKKVNVQQGKQGFQRTTKAPKPPTQSSPGGPIVQGREDAPAKGYGSLYDRFLAKISPRAARIQERDRQSALALRLATKNGYPKMADTNAAARTMSRHAIPDCGRTYCDCGPHDA